MRTLREQRKNAGLFLKDMEVKTGISFVTLSLIERGLQNPGPELRSKLEKVLGPVNWIETGKLKIQATTKANAYSKVKELFQMLYGLPDKDRREITALIKKNIG